MTQKIFYVRAIEKFLMHYAIVADSMEEAEAMVHDNPECYDFSQEILGTTVTHVSQVDEDEFIRIFDKVNSLKREWPIKLKLAQIHGYIEQNKGAL